MQPTPSTLTRIRDADRSDLAAVAAVLRAANAEFARVVPPSFFRAYLRNLCDLETRFTESQILVAEAGDQVVGTVAFYPDASREAWDWPPHWTGIRATAVLPTARGRGLGRRLVQACVDRSQEIGAPAVCLHTGAFMTAAMALYERFGFGRCPRFDREAADMFASDPSEPPVAVLAYRLDL